MPYLQLDLPMSIPPELRGELATAAAAVYVEVMETDIDRVSVAFRELGPGGVLRAGRHGVREVVVVHADVRRGRPRHQREQFARALTARLTSVLGVGRDDVVLYFTQHHPDEIFREGRFTDAWRAS